MPTKLLHAVPLFHESHGQGTRYRRWHAAHARRLGKRLHPLLRALAEEDGWASYGDQALWHCDPDDWAGVAAPWLPSGTKQADVLFRTGFGDLFVWDGTWIWFVMVHKSVRMRCGRLVERLLGALFNRPSFYVNEALPAMMTRARKKAGPLEPGEMYSYVPALALGGSEGSSRIVRSKAHVALDILSQAAPIKEMGI